MAENKEITTLHPYMNRNKNRYPNVREENIPDTIQRKLTAGQGISISPENVISATGGDSYTRSETDALLDTKADKVALENVNKVVPTDIAVKNGKLGLERDTTWLTNQNAINLGSNITYDATTKTLNAKGGDNLPTGTDLDPFILDRYIRLFNSSSYISREQGLSIMYANRYINLIPETSKIIFKSLESTGHFNIYVQPENSSDDFSFDVSFNGNKPDIHLNKTNNYYVPVLENPTTDGTYNLQITKTGSSYHYDWVAGGGYNHYIVISDGTASNAIYLLIPSTNNLICSSLTELDTLLGTTTRFIQASGVVTDTASKLPIIALNWQGSFSSSKIVTISSEEATTKFTDITDVVEPA